jgi:WD40 repeat protein
VTPSYYGQIARGKNDKRVTSVLFSNDPNGKSLLLCGGEEGSVQVWDVMSLKIIEQYRKHSTEVTSLSIRPQVDSNFVIAGDQNGKISSWTKNT